ncbi:MAG: metal ABC transporter ATP-binding protein [Clostridia bacterium]|jgi:zinc transport system ATP-binding protein|nr:metal ABC transporter ATP-binding protein [Clostridia bacterium]
MIKLIDVGVNIENNNILEGINLEINKGDFLAILGPNGGGKTTLIKLMLGLIEPNQGKVEKSPKLNIGYVPQFNTFNKMFPIKVRDVVLSGKIDKGIKLFKKYSLGDKKEVFEVCKKLGIENLLDRKVDKLSGGEVQKVLIARALVSKPELIVLDEPTASLDRDSKKSIYELLNKLNKDISVVVVSHDTHVISKYTKNIFCVNKTGHCHVDTKEHFEEVYGENMEEIVHRELDSHD